MFPAVATYHFGVGESVYLLVIASLIVYLNKIYFRLYKILPFSIEIERDTIVCTNFIRGNKKIVLRFSEIINLKGGVFTGRSKGLMEIESGKETIGFFHHLTNANIFITTLLQNIPQNVYQQVEPKIKLRLKQ